ncbi:hypothetical protein JCM5296_003012 [Sporobolomyces johnsonii]
MTTSIASVSAPLVLFTSKFKSPDSRFANNIVVTMGSDRTPECVSVVVRPPFRPPKNLKVEGGKGERAHCLE